jgi:hypothetical protein
MTPTKPLALGISVIACFMLPSCRPHRDDALSTKNASISKIYRLHPEFLRLFGMAYPLPKGIHITGQGMLEHAGFTFPEGAYVTSHPGYWQVKGPASLHKEFLDFHLKVTGNEATPMDWEDFDMETIYGPKDPAARSGSEQDPFGIPPAKESSDDTRSDP